MHSWLKIGETDGKAKKERLYDKLNFSITNIAYTVDKIQYFQFAVFNRRFSIDDFKKIATERIFYFLAMDIYRFMRNLKPQEYIKCSFHIHENMNIFMNIYNLHISSERCLLKV